MKRFSIHWADCGWDKKGHKIGFRPIVIISETKDTVECYTITSRNQNGKSYYCRMNKYLINGYCNCSKSKIISKNKVSHYIRDCTSSEISSIIKLANKIKSLTIQ